MKGWQIAIIVVIFFALGYFLSNEAFASEKSGDGSEPDYEPGKSYPDTETGGVIECYLPAPSGVEPLAEVYMSNTEPPLLGKLFKKTNKAVCYKFPKA